MNDTGISSIVLEGQLFSKVIAPIYTFISSVEFLPILINIDIVRIFSCYQTACEITSNWSSNLHLLDMFIGYSDYFFL